MNFFRFSLPRALGMAVVLGLALASMVSAHPDGHVLTQPWVGSSVIPSHPMPQMPGR